MSYNKLINFKTRAQFDIKKANIPKTAIVFIEDTGEIWTHDKFFAKTDGSDHNHDNVYLKLTGGTLTGNITAPKFLSVTSDKSIEMTINSTYGKIQTRGFIPLVLNPEGSQVAIGKTSAAEMLDVNGFISASGFKKTGSSDSYLLLGGGGHTNISNLENPYEANLKWGGKNFSGTFGCIDAAMVPFLGANRLAFMPSDAITVEYSRDSGATWIDYGATDAQKAYLFAGPSGSGLNIGKCDSTNKDDGTYRLRVTINTGVGKVYTQLNKFCILLSSNGSTGLTCTIDAALEATPTVFDKIISNNTPVSGWSGYNVINVPAFTTYGNTASSQYGRVRFTFASTGGSTTYTGLQLYNIFGYGGVGWITPSNMAKWGQIYTYDNAQGVSFPGTVSVASNLYERGNRVYSAGNTNIGTGATNYAAGNQPITAISTTATAATFTRGAGNLTLTYPTFNQNTSGDAAGLSTTNSDTTGSTGNVKYTRFRFIQKASDTETMPDTGWWSLLRTQHGGYDNGYWQEMAYNFSKDEIKFRRNVSGTKQPWKTIAFTDSNITGNASTANNLKSIITTFDGKYPVTVNVNGTIYSHGGLQFEGKTGILTTTTFKGALDGNAATATKLQTSRTLWGQSFDGTGNVSGSLSNVAGISFTDPGGFVLDRSGNLMAQTNSTNSWNIHVKDTSNALKAALTVYTGTGLVRIGHVLSSDIRLAEGGGKVGIGISTPTEKLHVNGNIKLSGGVDASDMSVLPKILIDRANVSSSGISFYNRAYNAWQIYMSNPTTGCGVKGNLTAPSGTEVTAWALRSVIEPTAGYGWTWESVTSSGTTPSIVAELSSVTGNFKTKGDIKGNSGIFTNNITAPSFVGNLTGNADTVTNGMYTNADQVSSIHKQFYTTNASGTYSTRAIELREVGLTTTTNRTDQNYAPALGFHWGGITQSIIALHSDGNFHLVSGTSASTTYTKIVTNGFLKSGSSDSYMLLGGGGHKALTDLYNTQNANLSTIDWTTKNLTVHGAGTFNSGLEIINPGGTWISQRDTTKAVFMKSSTTSNYHILARVNNTVNDSLTIGNIGNYFGFYGYRGATTANATSSNFMWDSLTGNWDLSGSGDFIVRPRITNVSNLLLNGTGAIKLSLNKVSTNSVILGPGHFRPDDDARNNIDLGIESMRWRNLYCSGTGNFGNVVSANFGITITSDSSVDWGLTTRENDLLINSSDRNLMSFNSLHGIEINTDVLVTGNFRRFVTRALYSTDLSGHSQMNILDMHSINGPMPLNMYAHVEYNSMGNISSSSEYHVVANPDEPVDCIIFDLYNADRVLRICDAKNYKRISVVNRTGNYKRVVIDHNASHVVNIPPWRSMDFITVGYTTITSGPYIYRINSLSPVIGDKLP